MASAFAEDAPSKKIKIGLRLGYALPMGAEYGASDGYPEGKLSDDVSGQAPIWIDAGYLVTPNLLVGLYGQYGFAQTKNCPDGSTCSAHDTRLGLQGQYHFSPAEAVDPWLGLGIGYEWLNMSRSAGTNRGYYPDAGTAAFDGTYKGFEFVNLQGGADFRVASALTVGPFLSFSLGKYSKISSNTVSEDLQPTAFHEWLTLGVKGTFGL